MSAESLTGLCEEADALALALACENRNVESDTVHRLAAKAKDLDVECDQWESDWTKVSEERTTLLEKVADLTRWEWLPRGRGVSLCRGGIGAPHGGTDRAESWVSRSGRGGEVTYEYRVTHSSDSGGNFDNEPPVPPADSKGWRLHSHSTCYDTDGRTVRITYVWEREARP